MAPRCHFFALIAPSGKILVGEEPEKGMTWFVSLANYKANYKLEKPVTDALTAFKKEHPFDKARVVIAGEGIGALVALNAAVNNPGMIKGAVAVNGGPSAELMATKAPTAGKMGLRARILFDTAVLSKMMAEGGKKEEEGPKLLDSWSKLLQTWGIAGETKPFTGDEAATKALIIESIHAVLARDAAPPAAKAEAPK